MVLGKRGHDVPPLRVVKSIALVLRRVTQRFLVDIRVEHGLVIFHAVLDVVPAQPSVLSAEPQESTRRHHDADNTAIFADDQIRTLLGVSCRSQLAEMSCHFGHTRMIFRRFTIHIIVVL